jgi:DNA end-binding protein Ku
VRSRALSGHLAERISFNQINRSTGNRIKYRKVDAVTGDEVESADIVKGYPVDKNVYLQVEDEEIEALQIESNHTIEIDSFVPLAEIDSRYLDSPYYIVPNDNVGVDAFAVIREAMLRKRMVGVGRVVMGKRERPIILEPFGKGIRATTLLYPYEVRKEDDYFAEIPEVKLPSDMVQLAEHIMESKAGSFQPAAFVDHYEEALTELLKQKQAGKPVTKAAARAPSPQTGNVIDLLKRSLELEAGKGRKKLKAPGLVPEQPKSRKRQRA